MKKPRIRIYGRDEQYFYNCDFVNKSYGQRLSHINAIFYVLEMLYLLTKDENGQYVHLGKDLLKPVFDK